MVSNMSVHLDRQGYEVRPPSHPPSASTLTTQSQLQQASTMPPFAPPSAHQPHILFQIIPRSDKPFASPLPNLATPNSTLAPNETHVGKPPSPAPALPDRVQPPFLRSLNVWTYARAAPMSNQQTSHRGANTRSWWVAWTAPIIL